MRNLSDKEKKKFEVFALTYLDNGLDAKEAVKSVHPHFNEEQCTALSRVWLRVAYVSEIISKITLQREQDIKDNSQQVLNDLQTLKELCFQSGDLKTAAKAIELQAKHLGILQDRHHVTQTLTLADLVKSHE